MKVYVLAFLVLAAAVTAASNEGPKRHGIKRFVKNPRTHKRFDDDCFAIKCGKLDESCDGSTICPIGAACIRGTCREPAVGDPCESEGCGIKLECDDGKCVKPSEDNLHAHLNKAVNRTNSAKKRSTCEDAEDCKQHQYAFTNHLFACFM